MPSRNASSLPYHYPSLMVNSLTTSTQINRWPDAASTSRIISKLGSSIVFSSLCPGRGIGRSVSGIFTSFDALPAFRAVNRPMLQLICMFCAVNHCEPKTMSWDEIGITTIVDS